LPSLQGGPPIWIVGGGFLIRMFIRKLVDAGTDGFSSRFRAGDLQLIAVLANGRTKMLETIAVVLVLLWLLGFVTSYTMGGLIHILLIVALVVILIRFMQGRRI
jgi:uncharacterized membrane protein